MSKKYVIAIDQGSTSTKIVVVDKNGDIIIKENMEIATETHSNGGVYHNPKEIFETVKLLLERVFIRYKISPDSIDSIGITNQRETTIVWDKTSGKEVYKAISWQSKDTADICKKWIDKGLSETIKEKTGLKIDSYFSASKIVYLLGMVKDTSNLLFGTLDTYILWNLTKGKEHKTDVSNASRTMIYNINDMCYDEELLSVFGIPKHILPEVVATDSIFGYYEYNNVNIPIRCLIGDQQGALFGEQCFHKGMSKNTYGTGCFLLMNTGTDLIKSENGLLTTIAWSIKGSVTYALEGSIFAGGSSMRWLRDQLLIIEDVASSSEISCGLEDDGVYMVPAFVGLGAPYWLPNTRGSILGLKKSTTKKDIIKATLNSIAYQVKDVLDIMSKESVCNVSSLVVDGGASVNEYLMQFQADILGINILKCAETEITALGAAYVAGLSTNFFKNIEDIERNKKISRIYFPRMETKKAERLYENWKKAVYATSMFTTESNK